jgi:hypothetical protein
VGWLCLEVSCVDEDCVSRLVWAGFTWKSPVLIMIMKPGWCGLALPGSVLSYLAGMSPYISLKIKKRHYEYHMIDTHILLST